MMRGAAPLALAALAACAPVQDRLARDAARATIRPVLAEQFPGVPLEPATDCIIDNATGRELTRLALDAARPAPDPDTAALIIEIATRPATLRCLTTTGLAPFLR